MSGSEIDPQQATSRELDRRSFVGLSAAATASLTTGAAAFAEGTLGQPHAPIVPEDDPSITVRRVELRRPDGAIPAYAAFPAAPRAVEGGVVVVMHIWGVDTSIRDVVRRLAKAGYATIAPDLYARLNAPTGDGVTDVSVFRPYAKQLDQKQVDGDERAAALWIASSFPKVKTAVLGFCMGGHLALIQAIDNADVFSAVVPFYGSPAGVDPAAIHIPVCGSYGARDTSIPADSVRAFRDALRVPNDIQIYASAGHAFFDDQRSSYVPAAAEDAWKRTISFLQKYLGTTTT